LITEKLIMRTLIFRNPIPTGPGYEFTPVTNLGHREAKRFLGAQFFLTISNSSN